MAELTFKEGYRTHGFALEIDGVRCPVTKVGGLGEGTMDVINQADGGSTFERKIGSIVEAVALTANEVQGLSTLMSKSNAETTRHTAEAAVASTDRCKTAALPSSSGCANGSGGSIQARP